MENRKDLIIDMTKEGEFIDPPQTEYFRGAFHPGRATLAERIRRTAIIVAVLGVVLGVAALALTFALTLIALVVATSVVAGIAYRIQLWRMRRG